MTGTRWSICAFHPTDRSNTIDGTPAWWETAVVYQLYVRSFADSNDDGIGDLAGIRSRLPYLADLGIDAIWLNPCYPSPQADHGYDVADYFDIEPDYGDLDEFDALVRDARAVGIRIMMDVVPNHCSSEHAWFRAALAAPPGSSERERFYFRDGRGAGGDEPPNNWQAIFGGSAWTRVDRSPTAHPVSGTSPCSRRPSPTSTGTTPMSSITSTGCSGSGSTAASRGSAPMP